MPSRLDGRAREIYETSYSARGLYARLVEDAAINPDTMDERRGGWGRLLSLFRLIHKGHKSHFVQARGGKLFDPDAFPFLEGRADVAEAPRIPTISDGCLLRVLEGLMTLQMKGGTRERLSYRALDVEQIGSVYETVMGFTVETASGRSLAIKAGKHNRTPVFVDLEKLASANGKERIKFLKEEADRTQLSSAVAKAMEAAKTAADLAVALDPIVDERGSPKKHEIAAGTPMLQPTDERRRTGSHYTPRSLTAPIVQYALEPAFERLGPNATPEQILDLKVCDPAMGSGAFLVEACRAIAATAGRGVVAPPGQEAGDPGGRGRGTARPPASRAALPLWRRQEPARHRSRQAVAMARDARARPRVHLPRSRAQIGRQPGGADAGADRGDALGHVEARPAAVPAAGEGPRRRGNEGPRRNPGRARRHCARHSGAAAPLAGSAAQGNPPDRRRA